MSAPIIVNANQRQLSLPTTPPPRKLPLAPLPKNLSNVQKCTSQVAASSLTPNNSYSPANSARSSAVVASGTSNSSKTSVQPQLPSSGNPDAKPVGSKSLPVVPPKIVPSNTLPKIIADPTSSKTLSHPIPKSSAHPSSLINCRTIPTRQAPNNGSGASIAVQLISPKEMEDIQGAMRQYSANANRLRELEGEIVQKKQLMDKAQKAYDYSQKNLTALGQQRADIKQKREALDQNRNVNEAEIARIRSERALIAHAIRAEDVAIQRTIAERDRLAKRQVEHETHMTQLTGREEATKAKIAEIQRKTHLVREALEKDKAKLANATCADDIAKKEAAQARKELEQAQQESKQAVNEAVLAGVAAILGCDNLSEIAPLLKLDGSINYKNGVIIISKAGMSQLIAIAEKLQIEYDLEFDVCGSNQEAMKRLYKQELKR